MKLEEAFNDIAPQPNRQGHITGHNTGYDALHNKERATRDDGAKAFQRILDTLRGNSASIANYNQLRDNNARDDNAIRSLSNSANTNANSKANNAKLVNTQNSLGGIIAPKTSDHNHNNGQINSNDLAQNDNDNSIRELNPNHRHEDAPKDEPRDAPRINPSLEIENIDKHLPHNSRSITDSNATAYSEKSTDNANANKGEKPESQTSQNLDKSAPNLAEKADSEKLAPLTKQPLNELNTKGEKMAINNLPNAQLKPLEVSNNANPQSGDKLAKGVLELSVSGEKIAKADPNLLSQTANAKLASKTVITDKSQAGETNLIKPEISAKNEATKSAQPTELNSKNNIAKNGLEETFLTTKGEVNIGNKATNPQKAENGIGENKLGENSANIVVKNNNLVKKPDPNSVALNKLNLPENSKLTISSPNSANLENAQGLTKKLSSENLLLLQSVDKSDANLNAKKDASQLLVGENNLQNTNLKKAATTSLNANLKPSTDQIPVSINKEQTYAGMLQQQEIENAHKGTSHIAGPQKAGINPSTLNANLNSNANLVAVNTAATAAANNANNNANNANNPNQVSNAKLAVADIKKQAISQLAQSGSNFKGDQGNAGNKKAAPGFESLFATSQNASNVKTSTVSQANSFQSKLAQTNLMKQIRPQLKTAISNHESRINIELRPKELGKVEVQLDFNKEGQLKLSFIAERRETLDLLARDRQELTSFLAQNGLDVSHQDLAFQMQQQQDSNFDKNQFAFEDSETNRAENEIIEEKESSVNSANGKNSNSTGIDIKV